MSRTAAAASALALALLCAACASPIKPALVDASGPKLRQATLTVKFMNSGGNPRINAKSFPAELALAMEREAPRATEGALTMAKAPGAAGHVIAVDATLLSSTTHTAGYYDGCAYKAKDGSCTGAVVGDATNYSRMRLHLVVTEAKSGRPVYRSDDQASRTVAVDDRGIDALARDTARAVLKALKESGLI